eukprot:2973060-Rhodomonas_salina.1
MFSVGSLGRVSDPRELPARGPWSVVEVTVTSALSVQKHLIFKRTVPKGKKHSVLTGFVETLKAELRAEGNLVDDSFFRSVFSSKT